MKLYDYMKKNIKPECYIVTGIFPRTFLQVGSYLNLSPFTIKANVTILS